MDKNQGQPFGSHGPEGGVENNSKANELEGAKGNIKNVTSKPSMGMGDEEKKKKLMLAIAMMRMAGQHPGMGGPPMGGAPPMAPQMGGGMPPQMGGQ